MGFLRSVNGLANSLNQKEILGTFALQAGSQGLQEHVEGSLGNGALYYQNLVASLSRVSWLSWSLGTHMHTQCLKIDCVCGEVCIYSLRTTRTTELQDPGGYWTLTPEEKRDRSWAQTGASVCPVGQTERPAFTSPLDYLQLYLHWFRGQRHYPSDYYRAVTFMVLSSVSPTAPAWWSVEIVILE